MAFDWFLVLPDGRMVDLVNALLLPARTKSVSSLAHSRSPPTEETGDRTLTRLRVPPAPVGTCWWNFCLSLSQVPLEADMLPGKLKLCFLGLKSPTPPGGPRAVLFPGWDLPFLPPLTGWWGVARGFYFIHNGRVYVFCPSKQGGSSLNR